jgi:tRNA pseudouridine38-40 synthase
VIQPSLGAPPAAASSEAEGDGDAAPPALQLVVAYDGTGFHGFAAQRDVRTVQGVLEDALAKVLGERIVLTGAGRTDAGVHAWGQVVSAPVPPGTDVERVQRSVNGQLAPEVVVRAAALGPASFDARHSARWRTYRYTVLNRPAPDPFSARFAWWVPEPLDLALLRLGADPFLGEHDFSTFCRKGPPGSTTVRRVLGSHWRAVGDGVLEYEIRATAFCWQMVRSVVGTLVDVGRGRIAPGELVRILAARDRAAAGGLAPPHGLCLWEVGY